MAISLSTFIHAPVDEVFAYFDDFATTLTLNDHAVSFEVVDRQPDGRRTFDILMRGGGTEWMQTTEQVVREPPRRLLTRAGSWNVDRLHWILATTTDRRFSTEGDGTRVDVSVETRLDHPLRRPIRAVQNWLQRDLARAEYEYQLRTIAARIDGVPEPDRPYHHDLA